MKNDVMDFLFSKMCFENLVVGDMFLKYFYLL